MSSRYLGHSIRVYAYWEVEGLEDELCFEWELIHPQACRIVYGCTQSLLDNDWSCSNYVTREDGRGVLHAHSRYDCPIMHEIEGCGYEETFGAADYTRYEDWMDSPINTFNEVIGRIAEGLYDSDVVTVPFTYEFWSSYSSWDGEYDYGLDLYVRPI